MEEEVGGVYNRGKIYSYTHTDKREKQSLKYTEEKKLLAQIYRCWFEP